MQAGLRIMYVFALMVFVSHSVSKRSYSPVLAPHGLAGVLMHC